MQKDSNCRCFYRQHLEELSEEGRKEHENFLDLWEVDLVWI